MDTLLRYSCRQRAIQYPTHVEALERIGLLHQRARASGYAGGLLLTGYTGSGKSTVKKEYAAKFPRQDEAKFFEREHIRKRIETGEEYKNRFEVVDGFDRYKVLDNVQNESDIEFIIRDKTLNHYYFVQVKHALLGERAFFSAAIQAAQTAFAKGINQLREAKRLLESGCLVKTLKSRSVIDATLANSSFVLLHNIAQFDFQSTEDKISLYDWASFRNLLLDAEVATGHSNGLPHLIRLKSPLLIDSPSNVLQRLFAEHPVYKGLEDLIWAAERIETRYQIEKTSFVLKGLGI